MAKVAKYTEQIVIMASAALKAHLKAAAEDGQVSDSEVAREWLSGGMALDAATCQPARLARVAELEAEMNAARAER